MCECRVLVELLTAFEYTCVSSSIGQEGDGKECVRTSCKSVALDASRQRRTQASGLFFICMSSDLCVEDRGTCYQGHLSLDIGGACVA